MSGEPPLARPLVVAHRSCPRDADRPVPENSLAGIRASVAAGADAVEIDVRLTRDGGLVATHDAWCRRALGRPGVVRLLTERRLTARRLLGSDETMSSFATLVAAVPRGTRIAVDLKSPAALRGAVATLSAAGRLADAMLWCRRPAVVRAMATVAPGVPSALLRNTSEHGDTLRYLRAAVDAGATAVSLHQDAVTPEIVAAAHDLGLTAYAWALSPQSHDPLLGCGVDGITTDWPGLLRELVDRRR